MNRVDDINLHHGNNGLVDIMKYIDGSYVIKISVCNPNGIGVHVIHVKMPENSSLGIIEMPTCEEREKDESNYKLNETETKVMNALDRSGPSTIEKISIATCVCEMDLIPILNTLVNYGYLDRRYDPPKFSVI